MAVEPETQLCKDMTKVRMHRPPEQNLALASSSSFFPSLSLNMRFPVGQLGLWACLIMNTFATTIKSCVCNYDDVNVNELQQGLFVSSELRERSAKSRARGVDFIYARIGSEKNTHAGEFQLVLKSTDGDVVHASGFVIVPKLTSQKEKAVIVRAELRNIRNMDLLVRGHEGAECGKTSIDDVLRVDTDVRLADESRCDLRLCANISLKTLRRKRAPLNFRVVEALRPNWSPSCLLFVEVQDRRGRVAEGSSETQPWAPAFSLELCIYKLSLSKLCFPFSLAPFTLPFAWIARSVFGVMGRIEGELIERVSGMFSRCSLRSIPAAKNQVNLTGQWQWDVDTREAGRDHVYTCTRLRGDGSAVLRMSCTLRVLGDEYGGGSFDGTGIAWRDGKRINFEVVASDSTGELQIGFIARAVSRNGKSTEPLSCDVLCLSLVDSKPNTTTEVGQ